MAPEQAKGKPVDRRADIWALGCVLFEMLTGQQAFTGDTLSDVLVRVLEHEPDWRMLPVRTPASICRLLHRCFEKDPKRRSIRRRSPASRSTRPGASRHLSHRR